MAADPTSAVLDRLKAIDADAAAWVAGAVQEVRSDPDRLRLAFARSARRAKVVAPSGQWATGPDVPVDGSPLMLARLVLLWNALASDEPERGTARVIELFRRGELREQEHILRALPYLPQPKRFVELAAEASRTNAVPVFEALACDNPFPANYLPDLNFNQLVLKALFLEVPLSRVEGLAERVTGELVRMARDYGSERRAAGRSVPEDIALIERLEKERSS